MSNLVLAATQSNLRLTNSQLLDNSAFQFAGAIYSYNTNVFINNSIFRNNSALNQDGGSLYFNSDEDFPFDCKYSISNSQFIDNFALLDGGAIKYTNFQPLLENVTFKNNLAIYGENVASFGMYLDYTLNSTENITVEENFYTIDDKVMVKDIILKINKHQVSGDSIQEQIQLVLKDNESNIILSDSVSVSQLVANDTGNVEILKSKTATAQEGVYTFTDFIIISKPGNDVILRVESDAISEVRIKNALGDYYRINNIYIKVHMRLCERGEYETPDLKCSVCQDGFYTLIDNQTLCSECPSNAICSNGFQIIPVQGYWRKDANQTAIFKCFNEEACLHKYDNQCAPGYGGNLCQSCEQYNDSWFSREGAFKCQECLEFQTNSLRLIGICLILYFLMLVWINIRNQGKSKMTTVYMRILTNYFQILTLAQSYDLSWQDALKEFLQYISLIAQASEIIVSQDCFIRDSNIPVHPQFFKLVVACLLPFIIIGLFVGFWMTAKLVYKRVNYKNNIIVSITILIFIAIPSITSITFSAFNCQDIFQDGKTYLTSDLDITCWHDEHEFYAKYIGIPVVIFWIVGLPAVTLIVLIINKDQLFEAQHMTRYGFLYMGLNHEAFYWEILIHFRKICMISINIYFRSFKPQYRALIGFIILIIYIEILQKIKPYQTERINDLEFKASIAAFSVFYGGLFFISNDLPFWVSFFLLIAILFINLIFWLTWFKLTFDGIYDRIMRIWRNVICIKCLRAKISKYMESEMPTSGFDEQSYFKQKTKKSIKEINDDYQLQNYSQVMSGGLNKIYKKGKLIQDLESSGIREIYVKDLNQMLSRRKKKTQKKTMISDMNVNPNDSTIQDHSKTIDDSRIPHTDFNEERDKNFNQKQKTKSRKIMDKKKNSRNDYSFTNINPMQSVLTATENQIKIFSRRLKDDDLEKEQTPNFSPKNYQIFRQETAFNDDYKSQFHGYSKLAVQLSKKNSPLSQQRQREDQQHLSVDQMQISPRRMNSGRTEENKNGLEKLKNNYHYGTYFKQSTNALEKQQTGSFDKSNPNQIRDVRKVFGTVKQVTEKTKTIGNNSNRLESFYETNQLDKDSEVHFRSKRRLQENNAGDKYTKKQSKYSAFQSRASALELESSNEDSIDVKVYQVRKSKKQDNIFETKKPSRIKEIMSDSLSKDTNCIDKKQVNDDLLNIKDDQLKLTTLSQDSLASSSLYDKQQSIKQPKFETIRATTSKEISVENWINMKIKFGTINNAHDKK